MKQIQLTQGKVALVDDEDYKWLSKFKWYAYYNRYSGHWYAARSVGPTGKQITVFMHREILAATHGVLVDHKDGNGLNNHRYNLRLATTAQNQHNRGKPRNNTSGYKGVVWNKLYEKWQAQIGIGGRQKNLGYFVNLEDAARAYNVAALEHFGEFAKLNEIP